MTNVATQARPAVQKLAQSETDQLYEELGIRLKAMQQDAGIAGSFDPTVTYNAAAMGIMDDVRAFGQKFFEKASREAYNLVCGGGLTPEEQKKFNEALGNKVDFASWFAALLVGHLAMAPAVAAVVAVLVLKLFFRPAHSALCEVWATKLK